MKTFFILTTLGFTLIISGCYSNASKESATDSAEQSAPASQSRSTRF